MKKTLILAPIVAILSWAPLATAQESLIEYLEESCKEDLGKYCAQVTPGEGRRVLCLGAHEDKISERCQFALEQATAAISYVARSCSADAEKLCPETQPGDGRLLECLESKSDRVSEGCKKAVEDVTGE